MIETSLLSSPCSPSTMERTTWSRESSPLSQESKSSHSSTEDKLTSGPLSSTSLKVIIYIILGFKEILTLDEEDRIIKRLDQKFEQLKGLHEAQEEPEVEEQT